MEGWSKLILRDESGCYELDRLEGDMMGKLAVLYEACSEVCESSDLLYFYDQAINALDKYARALEKSGKKDESVWVKIKRDVCIQEKNEIIDQNKLV